jgi:hypothetical protein
MTALLRLARLENITHVLRKELEFRSRVLQLGTAL